MRLDALFLCTVLVVASQLPLRAAGPVTEDVPVPGGTAVVAAALGISPVPERARFVGEAARILYGHPSRRAADADALALRLRLAPPADAGASEQVPIPLTLAVWRDTIFRRRLAPAELVVAILSDRQAAYLCHGLTALDDETLEYLEAHKSTLAELYERAAPVFAVFSGSVHVHDGRVVPPGGEEAVPLWEAVVGETVQRPDRFFVALFTEAEGRTAYLFDTVGQLDRPRQRFALGLGLENLAARVVAARALVAAWNAGLSDWRAMAQPFARQPFDAATLLMRVAVDAAGRPAAPASRTFWQRVFESSELPGDAARLLRSSASAQPIDAAWLLAAAVSGDARTRAERLDQFAFGQRVFAHASDQELPDALVATRAFRRYRMLMVTLERMGLRAPALYAAAARLASRTQSADSARAFVATAQFQGALALLARMRQVGTLDHDAAGSLVASLVALPLDDDSQYLGELVRWLAEDLARTMRPADTLEDAVTAALSGPEVAAPPIVEWEGHRYRLDFAAAERLRLTRVRERQSGATLDLAVELLAAARTLSAVPLSMERVRAVGAQVKSATDGLSVHARRTPEAEGLPSGVAPPPSAADALVRAADELTKLSSPADETRAARAAREIVRAAEAVAAQTLVSWAYAVDIGDPDGTALLPGDISRRHDFGFGLRDSEQRLRAAWALPRQDVAPGVSWHVDGSLLGLDVGLATVAMRRLNAGRSLDAPTLTANERETFAVGYGLMRPAALTDAARDAIAAAIANGRARVEAIADETELSRIATELNLDGQRLRAMRWTLARDSGGVGSMLSLAELSVLGHAAPEIDLDPWGTSAMISTGCVCTEMPRPGRLSALSGRPQIGLLATAVPDLNLRVAVVLAELRLPAQLAKYVLGAAVQDFIDEVRASDPDDWLTMVRTAGALTRERIEDYVAAAAADGPLVPDVPR